MFNITNIYKAIIRENKENNFSKWPFSTYINVKYISIRYFINISLYTIKQ